MNSDRTQQLSLLVRFCSDEELTVLGFDGADIKLLRGSDSWGVFLARRVAEALFDSPAALRPFDSPVSVHIAP